MPLTHPDRLVASWDANAAAWTDAVRSGQIASRRLATDAAAVDAVVRAVDGRVARVLDVGCGEGWLSRALADRDSHPSPWWGRT